MRLTCHHMSPRSFHWSLIALWAVTIPMLGGQPVAAQGIVGEAIGKLIQPAIGPIIERGIDEGFNEIIRRRPGRGGGGVVPLPWPRPRPNPGPGPLPSPQPILPGPLPSPQPIQPRPLPSPQPIPWPQPSPQPQPWPQPTPSPQPQPQPWPQPVPSPQPQPSPQPWPQPSPQPPVREIFPAPGNSVPQPQIVPSEGQIIRSRVIIPQPSVSVPSLSAPSNTLGVEVTVQRNSSLSEHALQHVLLSGPELASAVIQNEVAGIRRTLTAGSQGEGSREMMAALDQVASISPTDAFDARQQAIANWKEQLSTSTIGQTLSPQDLAIVSQRTKNLSNLSLLTEMARVMGTRRQQDLFSTLDQAAVKSNAPRQLMQLLTGSVGQSGWQALPQLDIPAGVPRLALANPTSNPGPVNFIADGKEELSLPTGGLMATSKKFVLKFQTGMGVVKQYTLKEGYFQFAQGENGWDVKQKTNVRFVLNAEHSPLPFHYTLNGKPMTLPAGHSVEHLSGAIQRIDFDRGLPDRSVSTRIAMPGRYLVGVNTESGAWDLYQKPKTDEGIDPTSVARRRWAESIDAAINPGSRQSDGTVGSLLDAIE